MGQSWAPVLAAVLATIFFAVYGAFMLVFPHRIRDRSAGPQSLRMNITLRLFGALLLLLSVVMVWAAMEAGHGR